MGFVTGSSQSLGSGENLIQDQSRIGQFSSGLAIIRLIFRFECPRTDCYPAPTLVHVHDERANLLLVAPLFETVPDE